MKYYNKYKGHEPEIVGERKKCDNTIYTFDIETTSYYILNGEIYSAIEYKKLSKDEQNQCDFYGTMYIWMFGINDIVYYGRTYQELKEFLKKLDNNSDIRKVVFIHNLSWEFQFLKGFFNFEEVLARKSRKVMRCKFSDYNIECRCSFMMSNCSLNRLSDVYNLPIKKKMGDLDYTKIRTYRTKLTEKELGYCEYDCLVVYEYIKLLRNQYEKIYKIPMTSTGQVRRELKQTIQNDWGYKTTVKKSINIDPIIYNRLHEAFMGGYTHANYLYTDEIIKNVDSFDFTSSYPFVLCTEGYPSQEFKSCAIKNIKQMSKFMCYIIVVKFYNIKCKYYNNFISASKCRQIKKARYDNGRIIQAEELEITITDVDFRFFLDTYTDISKDQKMTYEILECYYSPKKYLHKTFINFVLDKYVKKTEYKNVEGKELEYAIEKAHFNSLYGMAVTNNIRDEVIYKNDTKEWIENPITNDDIIKLLEKEKKEGFLSFAFGVWVTAYARNNLLRLLIKYDNFVLYSDTDSLKLKEGFDISFINDYNINVIEKIKKVCDAYNISFDRFSPKDSEGIEHTLGIFENDGMYNEFITQGAKKYAYTKMVKNKKLKEDTNIIEKGETESKILEITVSGVPKKGANCLKKLEDFRDDLIFDFDKTNKNTLMYCENQQKNILIDYLGESAEVDDLSACCLIPCTYTLAKSYDYMQLLTDESSRRAVYNETN